MAWVRGAFSIRSVKASFGYRENFRDAAGYKYLSIACHYHVRVSLARDYGNKVDTDRKNNPRLPPGSI
jgi:hypothetical protein